MVKNYDNMSSHFHLIHERHGQTDRRTDRIAISISCVSVLTRDKNMTPYTFNPNLLKYCTKMQLNKYTTS